VPKRLSVFLLIRSLETGGAERQLTYLASGLQERGFRVTVGTFYRRGPLVDELERSGIPVIDLRKRGRGDIFGFLFRASRAVARSRPSLVYSFLGGANLVAAAVCLLLPDVDLVWSIRGSDVDLRRYHWTARLSYWIERALSRFPKLIIANSYAGRNYAASRGFPRNRIAVVPNGIDTERFHPDPEIRAEERHRLDLSNETVAVGVLARLDPKKGHAVFLAAAEVVGRTSPAFRFFCIGDGPEELRLKAMAVELGIADRVTFTGRMEPLAALNMLDIYCSSSSFGEGFSNSLGEAMACGVRCIATDVGDSSKIIGDSGTVVPREDPAALAAAILAEANRIRKSDRSLPRNRIIANFSVPRMVDDTIALLAQVCARDRRSFLDH
jgi:glycosyltransferase involved in cell wall biosynthesis